MSDGRNDLREAAAVIEMPMRKEQAFNLERSTSRRPALSSQRSGYGPTSNSMTCSWPCRRPVMSRRGRGRRSTTDRRRSCTRAPRDGASQTWRRDLFISGLAARLRQRLTAYRSRCRQRRHSSARRAADTFRNSPPNHVAPSSSSLATPRTGTTTGPDSTMTRHREARHFAYRQSPQARFHDLPVHQPASGRGRGGGYLIEFPPAGLHVGRGDDRGSAKSGTALD